VELYDVEGEPIFMPENEIEEGDFENMIPKMAKVVSAIQCNGIWFAGGKFGVTWQLKQSVVKRPVKLQGRCFIKLSEKDRKQLDTESNENSNDTNEEYNEHNTNVEDSDNENEFQETQDEDIQETKPKKTKKRVVKKKTVSEEA
jgi:hypothetical protein